MYQHTYEKSTLDSACADIEQYCGKHKAQRELYEAIDTLNSVMQGPNKYLKLKMGKEFNEVLLVDTRDNCVVRILLKDEILAIHASLKRLFDSQIH